LWRWDGVTRCACANFDPSSFNFHSPIHQGVGLLLVGVGGDFYAAAGPSLRAVVDAEGPPRPVRGSRPSGPFEVQAGINGFGFWKLFGTKGQKKGRWCVGRIRSRSAVSLIFRYGVITVRFGFAWDSMQRQNTPHRWHCVGLRSSLHRNLTNPTR
jgi:hypothetical protein